MLAERKLSTDRLRQLEQANQQLNVAHESLDKAKAELIAVRAERDATVRHALFLPAFRLSQQPCTVGEQTEGRDISSERSIKRQQNGSVRNAIGNVSRFSR